MENKAEAENTMEKEYAGKTKNGFDVFVDMKESHASTHFAHHPKLFGFVKKTIPTIELTSDIVRIDRDMGEPVGTTDLVETNDTDEIVYALRPLRTQYSRFVKNKEPQLTNWITIDLRKSGEDKYDLYTAYVGKITPSFPGGNILPEQSSAFWSKHALVWGSQEVEPGTETTECPW